MSNYNKIKITQQEINDIYEVTNDEPFPKVKEVKVEEEQKDEFLTDEEQEIDDKLFEDNPLPQEES